MASSTGLLWLRIRIENELFGDDKNCHRLYPGLNFRGSVMLSDPIWLSNALTQLVGGIVGGMLVVFALGKLIEVAILKKLMNTFGTTAWSSSLAVFAAILLMWVVQMGEPHMMRAFPPVQFLAISIAALIIAPLRISAYKRRAAKAAPETAAA
jgi:hypothetical protein